MRTPNNERLSPDIAEAGKARETAPERRCILSGERAARDHLVRLAIGPSGEVLPDVAARAPGRGAWLGVTRAELEQGMEKGTLRGALARAFKGEALQVPTDLPTRIEEALLRQLLDRLGLELRAGHVLLGAERIAASARGGAVELLLHARDASEDGTRKLDQAWRVGSDTEGSDQRGLRLPLDRAALSVALGRDNVVHLALADRGAADRVRKALTRLLHFQGGSQAAHENGETGRRNAAPTQ